MATKKKAAKKKAPVKKKAVKKKLPAKKKAPKKAAKKKTSVKKSSKPTAKKSPAKKKTSAKKASKPAAKKSPAKKKASAKKASKPTAKKSPAKKKLPKKSSTAKVATGKQKSTSKKKATLTKKPAAAADSKKTKLASKALPKLGPETLKIRERLLGKRSDLLKLIQSSKSLERDAGDLTFSNEIDLASSLEGREMVFQLTSRDRNELRLIEDALFRINEGTYGACESCEKKISLKRLQIMPLTSLCIECQEAAENL